MRSTTFTRGKSGISVQEHTPDCNVNLQVRHGQTRPKRSEQTVNDGQPVNTAAQGGGSSPGVQGMKSPSRESTATASNPAPSGSSASNDVSALASTISNGGFAFSLEQDKNKAAIDCVARSAQAKRQAPRANFIADHSFRRSP
jgi:hypothetical protein